MGFELTTLRVLEHRGTWVRKIEWKENPGCLIHCLLVAFTPKQLEIFPAQIERLWSLKKPCLFGGTGIPPVFILSSLEANHWLPFLLSLSNFTRRPGSPSLDVFPSHTIFGHYSHRHIFASSSLSSLSPANDDAGDNDDNDDDAMMMRIMTMLVIMMITMMITMMWGVGLLLLR